MTHNNITEKLQKVLARHGFGSRRQIEKWIEQGRIKVNGQLAGLGKRVSAKDKLSLDNQPLKLNEKAISKRVILYHKHEGEVCSRKPQSHERSVFDQLPPLKAGKWLSIGRLDINTSGLLLMTNNGELANAMMHPSSQFEREYAVRVYGEVTNEALEQMINGIQLEDGWASFDVIESSGGRGANQWFHVIVKEGRNRLVRRLWESQGLSVSRLIRVRFGEIVLPHSLRPGQWIELPKRTVQTLDKM